LFVPWREDPAQGLDGLHWWPGCKEYEGIALSLSCPRLTRFVDNTKGSESIFTKFHGFDLMFHISTYLPFDPKDERKVHTCLSLSLSLALVPMDSCLRLSSDTRLSLACYCQ
jgi:hypothetical protein